MRLLDQLRSKEVSTNSAIAAIAVLCVVAVLAVIIIARSAGGPAAPVRISSPKPVTSKSKTDSETPQVVVSVEPVSKTKQKAEKAPYEVIWTRNLFSPHTSAGSTAEPISVPPGGKLPGADSVPLPPMPVGPLPGLPGMGGGDVGESKKSLAFTGIVTSSAGVQALVENISTKELRYVRQGEEVFGCLVLSISPQVISLQKDGAVFTLAIGENKPDSGAGGGAPPPGDKSPPKPPPGGPGPERMEGPK